MDKAGNTMISVDLKSTPSGRKLRKSCSLETCHQKPGECMHCTCDGRCGQHPTGKCGVRREGSGKNCKRPDCPRDDTCLHSTRATCCHCRNLVSSHSRSIRAKRAAQYNADKLATLTTKPTTSKRVRSNDPLQDDLRSAFVHFSNPIQSSLEKKGLSEYAEWKDREESCNLIVIVEGVQFNLHKFPILFQCSSLKLRLDSMNIDPSITIPVLDIPKFPGGPAAFELACIFCYTNQVNFFLWNIPLLYCAANFLGLHRGGRNSLLSQASEAFRLDILHGSNDNVVHFLHSISNIHHQSSRPWMDKMIIPCINRLVMAYPFNTELMVSIQALPCDLFLRITQMVLTRKSNMSNIVAKLCAQAHLTEMHKSRDIASRKAESINETLHHMVNMDSHSSNIVLKVASEIGFDYGSFVPQKQRNTGRILAQAITQALTVQ